MTSTTWASPTPSWCAQSTRLRCATTTSRRWRTTTWHARSRCCAPPTTTCWATCQAGCARSCGAASSTWCSPPTWRTMQTSWRASMHACKRRAATAAAAATARRRSTPCGSTTRGGTLPHAAAQTLRPAWSPSCCQALRQTLRPPPRCSRHPRRHAAAAASCFCGARCLPTSTWTSRRRFCASRSRSSAPTSATWRRPRRCTAAGSNAWRRRCSARATRRGCSAMMCRRLWTAQRAASQRARQGFLTRWCSRCILASRTRCLA
mmetsp:Transcript_3086/g.8521  ORF Transcript_3086/g.8521 Transcript_3086/m.8521 type:complete len:263 (+) Transcript_3086:2198-2986(+)